MDESFHAKRFKSNKMTNSATSGSEPTLHVSKQDVGLDHTNLRLIIRSMVLQMQLVKAIGRKLVGLFRHIFLNKMSDLLLHY